MTKKRLSALSVAVILIFSLILSGCEKKEPSDITVKVMSEGGEVLSDVGVYIYSDSEMTDLFFADFSDNDGLVTFTGDKNSKYTVSLKDVPEGYGVEESYTVFLESSDIVLKSVLFPEDSINGRTFKKGDVFFDFSVTDTDGNTHKLSELLKTKKAVVLNFWFINCAPCRMEFPFLSEAYENYKDDVAVLAINPYDGDNASISAYAKENNVPFPMVKGDAAWQSALGLTAYPTTVIIDRYGFVAMSHTGYFQSTEDVEKIFDFFSCDGYTQTVVNNLSDINDIK